MSAKPTAVGIPIPNSETFVVDENGNEVGPMRIGELLVRGTHVMYRKRWKVERTFAWLGNFRRLVVRYERHIQMYQAFFHLACLMIVLNRF